MIPHRRFGKHYRFSRADAEEIVRQMERAARPTRSPFRAACGDCLGEQTWTAMG